MPASVDDSQIDQEILASQQKLSRESKIKVWLLPFMKFITEQSNKVICVNVNFPEISIVAWNICFKFKRNMATGSYIQSKHTN